MFARPAKKIFARRSVLLLATVLCLLVSSLASTPAYAAISSSALLPLHNQSRAASGLQALTSNKLLAGAAQAKAQDMLKNQYFAHTSPAGLTPWSWIKSAGYEYEYAGENLAIDFSETQAVYNAWMQSSAHRANILNGNYTEVGIATASGNFEDRETTVAVVMFGKPKNAIVAPELDIPAATATTPQTSAPAVLAADDSPTNTPVATVVPVSPPKDTTPPPVLDVQGPETGAFLQTNRVQIAGQTESAAEVKIFENESVLQTIVADVHGRFSAEFKLADGQHKISLTATDQAANESEKSEILSFTVDTTAPLLDESQTVYASTTALSGHTFLARVQAKEPVADLTARASWGREEIEMQADETTNSFVTTLEASSESATLPLSFVLVDKAGNETTIPEFSVQILTSYVQGLEKNEVNDANIIYAWGGLHFLLGQINIVGLAFCELACLGLLGARKYKRMIRQPLSMPEDPLTTTLPSPKQTITRKAA